MRTIVYEDALNEVLIGNTFAAPIPRDGERSSARSALARLPESASSNKQAKILN